MSKIGNGPAGLESGVESHGPPSHQDMDPRVPRSIPHNPRNPPPIPRHDFARDMTGPSYVLASATLSSSPVTAPGLEGASSVKHPESSAQIEPTYKEKAPQVANPQEDGVLARELSDPRTLAMRRTPALDLKGIGAWEGASKRQNLRSLGISWAPKSPEEITDPGPESLPPRPEYRLVKLLPDGLELPQNPLPGEPSMAGRHPGQLNPEQEPDQPRNSSPLSYLGDFTILSEQQFCKPQPLLPGPSLVDETSTPLDTTVEGDLDNPSGDKELAVDVTNWYSSRSKEVSASRVPSLATSPPAEDPEGLDREDALPLAFPRLPPCSTQATNFVCIQLSRALERTQISDADRVETYCYTGPSGSTSSSSGNRYRRSSSDPATRLNPANLERNRDDEEGEDLGDEENGDRRRRRLEADITTASFPAGLSLACPFAKHDPDRFSDLNPGEPQYHHCPKACLKEICRVK